MVGTGISIIMVGAGLRVGFRDSRGVAGGGARAWAMTSVLLRWLRGDGTSLESVPASRKTSSTSASLYTCLFYSLDIDVDNVDYEAEWLKKIKLSTLAYRSLREEGMGVSYRSIQNPVQKIWPGCMWWVHRTERGMTQGHSNKMFKQGCRLYFLIHPDQSFIEECM